MFFLKDSSLTHGLTLYYTRGLGITVLLVMVSQPYGFSPSLSNLWLFNYTRVVFQMSEDYAAKQWGQSDDSYCTANNFGLMCSRKRISQNSFPNLIYIMPKSFTVFCQQQHNPKRNYENQI
jgi:hypothetical protein